MGQKKGSYKSLNQSHLVHTSSLPTECKWQAQTCQDTVADASVPAVGPYVGPVAGYRHISQQALNVGE